MRSAPETHTAAQKSGSAISPSRTVLRSRASSSRKGARNNVARGSFTLGGGNGRVILLSAGIGVTPVLALAAVRSPREVWWIHGAHDGSEHPFAEEVRTRLRALPHTQLVCFVAMKRCGKTGTSDRRRRC
jgi:ferredoxin-NADP reductase